MYNRIKKLIQFLSLVEYHREKCQSKMIFGKL